MLGIAEFQMQGIARAIFIDDLTGSAFITSIVAMGFGPTLLLVSLYAGAIGDRVERRKLIQISQGFDGLLALVVAVLIVTGEIHWWHMFAASLIQGASFSFQAPARQAVIPHLVGKSNITNAISLNSAGMGFVTIIAPGIAGILYGVGGAESVYFLAGAFSLIAVAITARLPKIHPPESEQKTSAFQDIKDGLVYTWSNRAVFLLIVSGFTAAMFAMTFRMQVPVFARRLFEITTAEIGYLTAALGIGALIATVITSNLRPGHHRGPLFLIFGLGLTGVTMLLLGLTSFYLLGLLIMVMIGFAGSVQMTLGQSLSVESTDDKFRARVMSLTIMSYGLMPLGALPMGYAVDKIGAAATLSIAGGILIVVALMMLISSSTMRRLS